MRTLSTFILVSSVSLPGRRLYPRIAVGLLSSPASTMLWIFGTVFYTHHFAWLLHTVCVLLLSSIRPDGFPRAVQCLHYLAHPKHAHPDMHLYLVARSQNLSISSYLCLYPRLQSLLGYLGVVVSLSPGLHTMSRDEYSYDFSLSSRLSCRPCWSPPPWPESEPAATRQSGQN
ncbi:hypothetical protein L227DRAFT_227384 [Lentinus tigrinus ALCF2SS1-6]|uniref:Uncharacterized protein n=1 Tax=Lentinus tigrinus ALCF2SS1-6 TaxID=1328759 RepID=A0A5C2S3Z9_9APHY|nr:hypothetical protein L227DRAFT_227384 [Lentinus tigrinus ALCF2SS1-6]